MKGIKKFATVLLFLLTSKAFPYRLSGLVLDENREPIPYATINIQNTTMAISSNIKGEYSLDLGNGDYMITFYCVGFEKRIIPVTIQGENRKLNVTLRPSEVLLSEATVSAGREDPAYQIIRNAIRVKEVNREVAPEYSCKTYLKASLVKEFLKEGPVDSITNIAPPEELTKERMNFLESTSQIYFQEPGKIKEITKALRDLSEPVEGGSVSITVNSNPDGVRSQPVKLDLFKTKITDAQFVFYNNLLDVPRLSRVPLVSPLHYNSTLSYKFRLDQSFLENGVWIQKIEVIPRRKEASLVRGYIYIVDSVWAIKSVDFTVDPATLNYFRNFRIIQNYEPFDSGKWLLSKEEFFYDKKSGKQTRYGNTIIQYTDYQLHPDLPKNFFNLETSVVENDALEKDSAFWSGQRPVPLKDEEIVFINRIDSIDSHHKSKIFLMEKDSIENRFHFHELLFGMSVQNSFTKEEYFFSGLINNIFSTMFPLGNIRPAIGINYKKEFKKGYVFKPDGQLKYGITNKDLRGIINLNYTYLPKKFGRAHVSYENDYGMVNSYEAIYNAVSMDNFINNIGYTAGHEIEILNGLFVDFTGHYLKVKPLHLKYDQWYLNMQGPEDETFSNGETGGRKFPSFSKVALDLTLKFVPFQHYATEPYKKIILGSKYPTFALNYRKGIKGLFESVADYDFLEFRVWDAVQFGTLGEAQWKIFAGQFLQSRSTLFTESKFFRRSDGWYFSDPIRSFQLLDTSMSTFHAYFEAHYLHNFEGKILNKIPWIKKLRLTESAGGGMLFINDPNRFRHMEWYAGIEKPITIARWKQRFKFGLYYVVSDSNHADVSSKLKFGIFLYDYFTNSWVR